MGTVYRSVPFQAGNKNRQRKQMKVNDKRKRRRQCEGFSTFKADKQRGEERKGKNEAGESIQEVARSGLKIPRR